MTGSIVSPATRARVRDLAIPFATFLGRLGLTPNALTVIGFTGTAVAAWAAANQWWLATAVLVLAFGIFDLFDGTLARVQGRASRFGAFLDSTLDRAGEAVVYLGIAVGSIAADFTPGAILAAAAMGAAFMVSYTRAKSEGLGFTPGTGMANVGLAPREVRIGILVVGLLWLGSIAAGLAPSPTLGCDVIINGIPEPCPMQFGPGGLVLACTLGLIAVLASITVIQRILHVRAQARED